MYVNRDITNNFEEIAKAYNLVALVGARQAGKTTLLRELMKNRSSSYVMFDDPDARSLFDDDVKKFELQFMEGVDLTVLDEVLYCADAGRKLKYLVDSGRKFWITSSSETVLGKEVLSHLVGRVSIVRLYPFTLPEFLRAKGQKALTQAIMERNVWEHMTYGGYPRVVTTNDPKMKAVILRDLHETMILKDVVRTFSISDIGALERCVKYLAVSVGGILPYGTVSKALGISFQTLKKYLDALEKSYLIIPVKPFHTNKAKEITKQPKIYFLDTGMRNAIAGRFDATPDGKVFENYVLSEIVKMGIVPKYWRTKSGAEVDFIIEIEGKIIPVEVKLSADTAVERSMRSFIDAYNPEKALVVSYKGKSGATRIGDCNVIFTDVAGMVELLP
jgi:predicted AAA+ superfamily ATPase